MDSISARLTALGYTLPAPPSPGGNYLPFRRVGNLVYLAGVICIRDGAMTHTGPVGVSQTVETAYEGAQVCGLNALAGIQGALGTLDALDFVVSLSGYVNAVPGFTQSPQVINGASDLLGDVFGEAGKHARAAVAVAGLPKDSTVEIQVTVAVKDGY